MINVPLARAALATAPGDQIVCSKAQMDQMLTEVEVGQRALIALGNLKAMTAGAATSVGLSI